MFVGLLVCMVDVLGNFGLGVLSHPFMRADEGVMAVTSSHAWLSQFCHVFVTTSLHCSKLFLPILTRLMVSLNTSTIIRSRVCFAYHIRI